MRHRTALCLDEDPSSASPLSDMAMLLLLICAIGVVSFMLFALAYSASLRGRNSVSLEYMEELEAKIAVITAENRQLIATLGPDPPQEHLSTPDGKDSSIEFKRDAEDFRSLAEEYSKTLEALVALRERIYTGGSAGNGRSGDSNYIELERLHLEKQTLLSKLRDLERDARFGSSGETRAIHAEIRKDGCLIYPEKKIVPCDGFGSTLLNRAFRDHIDLVVLWIRPGTVEPYYSIYETFEGTGVRLSHEPLPIGESVEAILAGLRYD